MQRLLLFIFVFVTVFITFRRFNRSTEYWSANAGQLHAVWAESDAQLMNLEGVSFDHPKPLVTAMCITRKRVPLLKRAVRDFLRQTYPSKELLIVYDNDDEETGAFHRKNTHGNVRFHISRGKKTLGELRNLAVSKSRGDFVVQWDDDDEYHPERIYYQLKHSLVEGRKASTLERWMISDDVSGKKYVSHARKRQGLEAGWEGTILAPKRLLLDVKYPAMKRGEDSVVTQELCRRNMISSMKMPHLYTYHLHGRNTYEREHGLRICNQAIPLE